jgi:hypothetical protein
MPPCPECERVAAPPEPSHEEWIENFRKGLHDTYNGGWHENPGLEAFHHGMDTVCNVLGRGKALENYTQAKVSTLKQALRTAESKNLAWETAVSDFRTKLRENNLHGRITTYFSTASMSYLRQR